MKLTDLLTDESKWSKEHDAADAQGFYVIPENPRAIKWSLRGAIIKCYTREVFNDNASTFYDLLFAIWMLFPGRDTSSDNDFALTAFNSHPDTTFADVRKVIEEAGV